MIEIGEKARQEVSLTDVQVFDFCLTRWYLTVGDLTVQKLFASMRGRAIDIFELFPWTQTVAYIIWTAIGGRAIRCNAIIVHSRDAE